MNDLAYYTRTRRLAPAAILLQNGVFASLAMTQNI
jgi:hypothetical protein